MPEQSVHKNHRERVKKRLRETGIESFYDHEILELLLFFTIPRRDTNPIAHRILDHFGGNLKTVLEAPYDELIKIEGVGDNSAHLISMLLPIFRRYSELKDDEVILKSPQDLGMYFVPKYMGIREETVMLLCLDSKFRVINCETMFVGSVTSSQVNVRRIVEIAIKYNAYTVVMAHNHPNGHATPSREDMFITSKIYEALRVVDVHFFDHIIVAEDKFISMAQNKLMNIKL